MIIRKFATWTYHLTNNYMVMFYENLSYWKFLRLPVFVGGCSISCPIF